MTDDLIESTFADLDSYYPGSKRKRKPVVVKKPEIELDTNWDSKPFKKTLPNGRDLEMFTIGALAAAVGRPIISIRAWIKEGYLPASPYRLPTKKDVHGKDHAGRRLYSRAMVEKLVEILDKAGLLHTKRIEWPLHRQVSLDIAEAWSQIRANENNDN
jgi:hypothetical protein